MSFVPTIVLTTLMLLIDRLYLTESIGLQSRFSIAGVELKT